MSTTGTQKAERLLHSAPSTPARQLQVLEARGRLSGLGWEQTKLLTEDAAVLAHLLEALMEGPGPSECAGKSPAGLTQPPFQDTGPRQAGRTMWPSLGNAPWADRCQVMLCFHGRRFNAGFVSSCSRTRALSKHGGPRGPPFIKRS